MRGGEHGRFGGDDDGVADDGNLTFEQLPARLATARAHVHQAPMYKRWIYVVGGHTNEDTSLGDVEIGTFE